MKRIATLLLAIVMLVSVMAPMGAFADTTNPTIVIEKVNNTKYTGRTDSVYLDGSWSVTKISSGAQYGGASGGDSIYTRTEGDSVTFFAKNIQNDWYTVNFWELLGNTSNYAGGYTLTVEVAHKGKKYTKDFVYTGSEAQGRDWKPVGVFDFGGSGYTEYVKITVKDIGEGSTVIRLSAVQFVPTAEPAESDKLTSENNREKYIYIDSNASTDDVTLDGSWSASTSDKVLQPTPYTNGHIYAATGKTATFSAKSLQTGWYEIEFWQQVYGNQADSPYEVTINSGRKTHTESYDNTGLGTTHGWIMLPGGPYYFDGSADQNVVFTPKGSTAIRLSTLHFIPAEAPATDAEDINVTLEQSDLTGTWTPVEGGFKTSEANASATFKPAEGFKKYNYRIDYNYVPAESPVTVKYAIYYNGVQDGDTTSTSVQEFVFSYGQDSYVDEDQAGTVYLGSYPFTGIGDEKVVVTRIKGTGELNASSLDFLAESGSSLVTLPEIELNEQIITYDEVVNNDDLNGWSKTSYAGWEAAASFTTQPSWTKKSGMENARIRFDTTSITTGYYDIWWYQIVDDATKDTDDIKATVYHNNEKTVLDITNKNVAVGTTEWIKITKEPIYFNGGSRNEYISIGGTEKPFRGAGIKFVPNLGVEEDIFYVANSEGDSGILGHDGLKSFYSNAPGDTLQYIPEDITEGIWNVSAYVLNYTNNGIADKNPQYIVTHNGKMEWIEIDKSVVPDGRVGKWLSLGDYDFAGEGFEAVTLYCGDDHEISARRANGTPTGTSVRGASLRFTKVTTQEEGHVLYVLPCESSGDDFAASSKLSFSGNEVGLIDAVNHVFMNPTDKDVVVKYYLPNYGAGTAKGTYKISTDLINLGNNLGALKVAVIHNGETTNMADLDPTTIDANTNKKVEIGTLDFAGHGAEEYVQITIPQGVAARLGAVTFELTENKDSALGGDGSVETTGTIDCEVTFGEGDAEFIPFPYAADAPEKTSGYLDASVTVVKSVSENGELVSLKANVFNGTDDTIAAPDVYVAVYSADGKTLKAIKTLHTDLDTIQSCETGYYFDQMPRMFYSVGDVIKMFVWDADLKPLLTTPGTTNVVAGAWEFDIDLKTE